MYVCNTSRPQEAIMPFVSLNNFSIAEVSTVCSEWLQLLNYVYDAYKRTKMSE